PRYQTLVRGFNLRWVGKPSYIQICGDTDQVVRTVQEAVSADRRITVRSGGHCYENFSVGNEGGAVFLVEVPVDVPERASRLDAIRRVEPCSIIFPAGRV